MSGLLLPPGARGTNGAVQQVDPKEYSGMSCCVVPHQDDKGNIVAEIRHFGGVKTEALLAAPILGALLQGVSEENLPGVIEEKCDIALAAAKVLMARVLRRPSPDQSP